MEEKTCKYCKVAFKDTSKFGRMKYCSMECRKKRQNDTQRIKAREYWRNLTRKKKDQINLKRRINGTNKKNYQKIKMKKGLSNKGSPEYIAKLKNGQKNRKGPLAGGWIDGRSSENKRIRASIEFRLWREAVFARDNWICQKCKERGGKLHPHHIYNFANFPELRFAIDNGITFCENCHRKFHKVYGRKNNNPIQLNKFLCQHKI